jgi:hypothetical protein
MRGPRFYLISRRLHDDFFSTDRAGIGARRIEHLPTNRWGLFSTRGLFPTAT